MLIEMINRVVSATAPGKTSDMHYRTVGQFILEELRRMEVTDLHLPIPDDPALTRIANALVANPADLSTIAEWAHGVAMSVHSLTRHVQRKTAMSFPSMAPAGAIKPS
jgi:transcriptional regulator GlxA family with amidase domain